MEERNDKDWELQRALESLRCTLSGLRQWGLRDILLPGKARQVAMALEHPMHDEPVRTATGEEERKAKGVLLEEIRRDLGECTRCPLHQGRTQIVFGEGDPAAQLVFVGEGPGADEDRLGRPFVGQAGQLLNKMIRAIGCQRDDVYICNVVKCRPPGNRVPLPEEIRCCGPFLIRQLEAIRPKVICTLGACASQTLLGTNTAISELRRKIHLWRGIPLIATYHPAYLLRNAAKKAEAWKDLLELMPFLGDAAQP